MSEHIVRGINRCGGCGLVDHEVECGGIYHCPNRFCLATGAWNRRVKYGYQDGDGRWTSEQLSRMVADCERELGVLARSLERLKREVVSDGR